MPRLWRQAGPILEAIWTGGLMGPLACTWIAGSDERES